MEKAYLMLGGNVGDRLYYLRKAIDLLNRDTGSVTAMSAIYESEPWGFDDPGWFLNQVMVLETDLTPNELLESIHQIEQTLGRIRKRARYQARTIDIDILLFGNHILNTPSLTIPHPQMAWRMFVLKPMAELVPGLKHPVLQQDMEYLRRHCTDTLQVRFFAQDESFK